MDLSIKRQVERYPNRFEGKWEEISNSLSTTCSTPKQTTLFITTTSRFDPKQ